MKLFKYYCYLDLSNLLVFSVPFSSMDYLGIDLKPGNTVTVMGRGRMQQLPSLLI